MTDKTCTGNCKDCDNNDNNVVQFPTREYQYTVSMHDHSILMGSIRAFTSTHAKWLVNQQYPLAVDVAIHDHHDHHDHNV